MDHNNYRDHRGNLRVIYTGIIHNHRTILVLRPIMNPHPLTHIAKIIKRDQIKLEKYKRYSKDRLTRPRLYRSMIQNYQNNINLLKEEIKGIGNCVA